MMSYKKIKVLLAPDSFKDCLSSDEVAKYIGEGISEGCPCTVLNIFPVADGGEGTASCIDFHLGGEWRELTVHDPLHRPVRSKYLVLPKEKTAVIELARASGLEMLTPAERNALKTSTLGTGELIKDALDSGIQKIILTIGGSATVDGGTGIAHALGFRFFDGNNKELSPCGEMIGKVRRIDKAAVHSGLAQAEILIACDVQNILNGSEGAARVYGPQKGADEKAVKILEKGLSHLSELLLDDSGFNADDHPGTGAAGGASLFLLAYGKGSLKPGFEIIAELTGFYKKVKASDLVISGEGRIDRQTTYGKLLSSIASVTAKNKKPFVAVAGTIDGDKEFLKRELGAAEIYSLRGYAENDDDSIKNAPVYLKRTGILIAEQIIINNF